MNKKPAAAAVGVATGGGGAGVVNVVGRPSLRSLAALAGVTSMTVSLALRDHPSISSATRTRLKKLAAKHGYRPDPMVAKLMQHLRTRRTERTLLSLCGLRLRPPAISAQGYDYGQQVCTGARGRAETLGYRFEEIFIDEPGQSPRRLQKLLTSRGVEGVLLLPMARPVSVGRLLDWSAFATFSATSSVLTPRTHTVMPDQFGNMMQLCRELTKQGRRRIGIATAEEHDVRVEHRVVAALGWHTTLGDGAKKEGGANGGSGGDSGGKAIPPLMMRAGRADFDAAELRRWVEAHELDALVSDSEWYLDQIAAMLPGAWRKRLTLVATSVYPPLARYAGINEKPEEVGAAAIEALAAMIQCGERGLPATPRTTLIAGEYVEPRGRRGRRAGRG